MEEVGRVEASGDTNTNLPKIPFKTEPCDYDDDAAKEEEEAEKAREAAKLADAASAHPPSEEEDSDIVLQDPALQHDLLDASDSELTVLDYQASEHQIGLR